MSLEDGAWSYVQDPDVLTRQDDRYPERGNFTAVSVKYGLVFTVYVELVMDEEGDFDAVRLVSSRPATASERKEYDVSRIDPKGRSIKKGRRHGAMSPRGKIGTFTDFVNRYPPPAPRRTGRPSFDNLRKPGLEFHLRAKERGWDLWQASKNRTAGARIAAMRRVWGWSQTELARKSGLLQSTLSHIESGESPVGAKRGARIAEALRVEAAWVVWGV